MTRYFIDSECDSVEAFHAHLKITLDLPDYYGCNADALWDCLTAWIELPCLITWRNFRKAVTTLGDDASHYRRIFEEAACEVKGLAFEVRDEF